MRESPAGGPRRDHDPRYIITIGGIYIFVGSRIARHVFGNPRCWGLTQIITIAYGVLVVAPVVLGLRFGVRVTTRSRSSCCWR